MAIRTYDDALEMLAERLNENTKDISQRNKQRRNQITDLYGIEYQRQGDGNAPATFYITISPDMAYMERFQFKLIVSPFITTSGNGTSSAIVKVNEKDVEINPTLAEQGKEHTHTSKPHTHTTQAHTHTMGAEINTYSTDAKDFVIKLDDVDITPYLMAQGKWIDGQGIYPSERVDDMYDLMLVASDLALEGKMEQAKKILQSGFKKVEISSSKPFSTTMVLYLKYSHTNR